MAEPTFDHAGRAYDESVVAARDVGGLGGTTDTHDATPDGGVLLGEQLNLDRSIGRCDQDTQFAIKGGTWHPFTKNLIDIP